MSAGESTVDSIFALTRPEKPCRRLAYDQAIEGVNDIACDELLAEHVSMYG